MTTVSTDSYLTPQELADHLRVSLSTVSRWRQGDNGPPYIRLGSPRSPVRYPRAALEDWLQDKQRSPR